MRIRKAGKITDHLWRLGTEESSVYFLEGSKSSAIISGGMSYLLPVFLRQLQEFGISDKKIIHLIILHTHFDHVGIIPYLKRSWPQLNVYASSRGWEQLSNPKAISVINDYTIKVTKRVRGSTDELSKYDWQWRDDVAGYSLAEGDMLDLGGIQIKFYETPGHSSCSISAYIPKLKIILPSDAVAIPYRDEYVIAANSDLTMYLQSMEKIGKLEIEILCADHYGYIIEEEARNYINKSKIALTDMINNLRHALQKEGSIDKAAKTLVDKHFRLRPDYFIAPEILLQTYGQMLKHVAKQESA
jgi:glyoxylase-like metal-dependent hydrolase (beta-lactamase superfamily II)